MVFALSGIWNIWNIWNWCAAVGGIGWKSGGCFLYSDTMEPSSVHLLAVENYGPLLPLARTSPPLHDVPDIPDVPDST